MAKYYGRIGFIETKEVPSGSGIWVEVPTEHYYVGEVVRNSRRWQAGEKLNDNLNISNEIIVVMDEYAIHNFHAMRYIEFMGAFWDISNVLVEHPHLRLTIGGVYNREDPNGIASGSDSDSGEQ